MKILRHIFILFSAVWCGSTSAQTAAADRTALVQLLDSCGGVSWVNNAGWKTAAPLEDWAGVTLNSNGRVVQLNLSSQNLINNLPASFCNLTELTFLYLDRNRLQGNLSPCFGTLTKLRIIDLSNNDFTGPVPAGIANFTDLGDLLIDGNHFDSLPDLSNLTEISIVECRNNKLVFADIIPNLSINSSGRFDYYPQDSAATPLDTLVGLRDTVLLNAGTSGTSYQWYKDSVPLVDDAHFFGTTTSTLQINFALFADSGDYVCQISHSTVPSLVLHRHRIRILIFDNRLPQQVFSLPGDPNICGYLPAKMTFENRSLLPYTMELISGPGVLTGDTLIPRTAGTFVIRLRNNGDDYYLPLNLDSTVVVSLSPVPDFLVEEMIPTDFGNEFFVNALADPDVRCLWILPNGDTLFTNEYRIARAFKEHEGNYTLVTEQNGCRNYTEVVVLKFPRIVKPYGLLTPNGDNKNDVLIIEGISEFPENEIRVFNAWQQQVYVEENYANTWDGGALPAGTYYLYLELTETQEIIKTSFVLRR